MSKMSNLLLSDMFFHAPDAPKLAPDADGELTMLPRHPSRRGRATPSPNTLPSVDACCVSIWALTAPRLSGPQHGPT